MEEYVVDCFLAMHFDQYLRVLVELILTEERTNRPIFNVLEEPVLFRYLRVWVLRGMKLSGKVEGIIKGLRPGEAG